MSARSTLLTGILAALVVGGCGGKKGSDEDAPVKKSAISKDLPRGLDLRLSNGKAGKPAFDRANLAPATKLDAPEVTALLARTTPLVPEPADLQAFAIRPGSQPPPRTGPVITASFPPPASTLAPPKPTDAGKGLTVLRWMPEGAVPIAPELSVTFSQAMVAVTSQTDAAKVQPVKLTPTPKGNWRWIGARTILFDPDVRFPQATTYSVEIPAGTKSATGEALAAAKTFTFETPTPTMISSWPSAGPQELDVPIFVMFDQKIDPKAVLAKLKLKANGALQATRLLDAAEIEKSHELKTLVAAAHTEQQDGRWLALRAKSKLPADASIEVLLPEGTPSAEGPNTTKMPQSFSFRTYPPLKVVDAQCGWGTEGCRPQTAIRFELNNPLDRDRFDPSQVTITPAIPDVRIESYGDTISIAGAKLPRSSYTVVVSGKLLDQFGQKLGTDERRTFLVGDPEPAFYGPSDVVVLDPAATARTLDFFSTSYKALKVRLYKVTPADYDKYRDYLQNRWRTDKAPVPPGVKVFDDKVAVTASQDALVETHVDLRSALDDQGLGQVLAIVEPWPWTSTDRPPQLVSWVQSTHLGIDAHVDADTMHVYVSELDSGKPAGKVQLELHPAGVKGTTDASGLAALGLVEQTLGTHYLIARRDNDVAFVSETNRSWSPGSWDKQKRHVALEAHVVDDRRLYRPGEEVSIKGWLRAKKVALIESKNLKEPER